MKRQIANASSCWLMKCEPECYSVHDWQKDGVTCWEGVRNYQARNFMRNEMKLDDRILFYHSNADPTAVAGVCKIVKESYPDFTAFDKNDKHFDPKSKKENPTWFMVDIKLISKFKKMEY